jgi:hypothetical protein
MVMAKQFPRDIQAATDRIVRACTREKVAQAAIYQYPRGGQNITGPSIRLAEVLAQNWGNVNFGILELSQSDGESSVMAFAWDLETNTRAVKTFQVPHVRYANGAKKALYDPRDIYETVANQGARRLRACILSVVPADIVETAMDQVTETRKGKYQGKDLKALFRDKTLPAFEKYGITEAQIITMLRPNAGVESVEQITITADEMLRLENIYTSIRDGFAKPEQYFKAQQAEQKTQKEKLKDMAEKAAPTEEGEPEEVGENDLF